MIEFIGMWLDYMFWYMGAVGVVPIEIGTLRIPVVVRPTLLVMDVVVVVVS